MTLPDPIHPNPSRTPQRRRWWSLSVRSLMVLVLIVGSLVGWYVRQVSVFRGALTTIEAAGGRVWFADQDSYRHGWWVWLSQWTGIELFREVTFVHVSRISQDPPAAGQLASPRPSLDDVCAAIRRLGRVGYVSLDPRSIFMTRTPEPDPLGALTEVGLAELAATPIDDLTIGVDQMTAAMLAQVCRLRQLKELKIDCGSTPLPPMGTLRAIAELTQLESLILNDFGELHGDDLASLRPLQALQRLEINPSPLADAVLAPLDALPQLAKVEFRSTRITDAGLSRLVARHPQLKELNLDGTLLTDRGVESLANLTALKSVYLVGAPAAKPRIAPVGRGSLTDASLLALDESWLLKELYLPQGQFTDNGLKALAGLPLTGLRLDSITSSGPGFDRLLVGRTFQHLELHGPGVTDADLPHLAEHLSSYATLDLSRTAVTDSGMRHLIPLAIRELDLSATALTDAGLAILATGTGTLSQVNASQTRVTPAGAAAFRAARPDTTLDIDPPR